MTGKNERNVVLVYSRQSSVGIEKFNYVRNILRYPETTDRPLINATDQTT